MRLGQWLVLAIAFASACDNTDTADNAAEVARELCKCLDVADPTCQATIAAAIATPSGECIACVFDDTNACAAMESQCLPLCMSDEQPEQGDR